MRISILTLLAFVSSASAAKPEPMDYYGLARALAIKEGKHLLVWVRSDAEEGITEVLPDCICITMKSFQGCQSGDAIYAEYRSTEGGWHEVSKIMNKKGEITWQSPKATQSGNCSTGNCAPSSSSVSRFGFRRK